jgi:hypothetical protein
VTPRRFALYVFLGTLLMQAAWIAVVPPFRGSDEFDHAFRAAAVAHGEWEAGDWARFGRGRLVTVPADLAEAANAQCAALPYTGRDNCLPVEHLPDGMVRIASSAGGYAPFYYWPIGIAGRPFAGAASLYAMRIAASLLCAIFIGLAAWCLAKVRSGAWLGGGLVLALSPVALYTTTIAAPNGLEITAALAVVCALIALSVGVPREVEGRILGIAGLSGGILVSLRLLGPEFLLALLTVTIVLSPRQAWAVVRRHLLLVAGVGTLVLAGTVAQLLWRSSQSSFGGQPVSDGFTPMRSSFVVVWQLQAIAAFPFREQPAPAAVYALFVGVLLAFLGVALQRGRQRFRIGLGLLIVCGLLLPALATWATYSGRGAIWQGRYGLPFLVAIPIVASLAYGQWRPPPGVTASFCAMLAVANVLSLLKVLNDEHGRAPSAEDHAWHAPSPALVVVLVLIAWLFYWRAVMRASHADG